MLKEFFILPKPKSLEMNENSGIRLTHLLTIFLNKHKVKDIALLISSRFNKHLGQYLNAIPIRDSYLLEDLGEKYFFACITSEDNFKNKIRPNLDTIIQQVSDKAEEKLSNYKEQTCKDYGHNLPINELWKDEGYFIQVKSENIILGAKSQQGFYNAVQTIIQIIDNCIIRHNNPDDFIIIPEMFLIDFPLLKFRGFHLDLKDQMPVFDWLKEFPYFLGKFKYNSILLEYEDKFNYKRNLHPVVHKYHLKDAQLEEFKNICYFNHITIIPLIQVFGHLERWLNKPEFKHLTESTTSPLNQNVLSLCPLHDESKPFIFEMIDQICAAHPKSPYIHLGADEVYQLGSCPKCSEFVKNNSMSDLYIYWVNLAAERVLSHNKVPIIWSDYLIKYPESISKLNKSVKIMYWDYNSTHRKETKLWIEREYWGDDIVKKTDPKMLELYEKYYKIPEFPDKVKLLPFYEYFKDLGHNTFGAPSVASEFKYNLSDWDRSIRNCAAHSLRVLESNSLGSIITCWVGCGNPLPIVIPITAAISTSMWNPQDILKNTNEWDGKIDTNEINETNQRMNLETNDDDFSFDWNYLSSALSLNLFEANSDGVKFNLKDVCIASKHPRQRTSKDINEILIEIRKSIEIINNFKVKVYNNSYLLDVLMNGLKTREIEFEVYHILENIKEKLVKFEESEDITLFSKDVNIFGYSEKLIESKNKVKNLIEEAKKLYYAGKILRNGQLESIFTRPMIKFNRLFDEIVLEFSQALSDLVKNAQILSKIAETSELDSIDEINEYIPFEDALLKISRVLYLGV